MSLIRTSAKGDYSAAAQLLKEGADVNAVDSKGRTALIEAAWSGYTKIVKLLLKYGAAVNCADSSGFTPLFRAVEEGFAEIVAFLLENGAEVNTRAGVRGSTPLMLAAEKGDREIIALLVDHGAKVNALDQFGETALDRAFRLEQMDAASLLQERGAIGKPERNLYNHPDTDLRPVTRAAVPKWSTVGEEAGLDDLDEFIDDDDQFEEEPE
jgi:ankyrin repeat protein